MLQKLYIQNYALIAKQEIDFSKNLNVITGETGAGKSILLGALGLILGNRSNAQAIIDSGKKCVVEGHFNIAEYQFNSFFKENELDFYDECIVRREISSSGKSRAFINDTPVSLSILKELTAQLVNLTAQHENLFLFDKQFQLKILDEIGNNQLLLTDYKQLFNAYKETEIKLANLKQNLAQQKKELDYKNFQLEELENAQIKNPNEQEELESKLNQLNNIETIKNSLSQANQFLNESEYNALFFINEAKNAVDKIADFNEEYTKLCERLNNLYYELQDITDELQNNEEKIEAEPEAILHLQKRLDNFIRLETKHKLPDLNSLITLRDELKVEIGNIETADEQITELQKHLNLLQKQLHKQAEKISGNRKKVAPIIEQKVANLLKEMLMPNAMLKINFETLANINQTGTDEVTWLFSANKGIAPIELKKAASGGELSRLMLSIQSIIASSVAMPTLIFDEIDTGISGEVSKKVGRILKQLAKQHQIICITHLPQIASSADKHLFVYKDESTLTTQSSIKILTTEESIYEIGQMLDGKPPTEAALNNARNLVAEMSK